MLELTNLTLHLRDYDPKTYNEKHALEKRILRILHLKAQNLSEVQLIRRSIDARKKSDVKLVMSVLIKLQGGTTQEQQVLNQLKQNHKDKGIRFLTTETETSFQPPRAHQKTHDPNIQKPIVVGAGCAGIFCTLTLAQAGLNPILIERGDAIAERCSAIERFNTEGLLDEESNVQFGAGGAGTFSDGKLYTGTKSVYHRYILQLFVQAGAPSEILRDAHPHIGTDILAPVIDTLIQQIKKLGGEVHFRTKMTSLLINEGRIQGIQVESPNKALQRLHSNCVVLATGHSARDVYYQLHKQGIQLEKKTFAMGVRIEHLQRDINKTLYGSFADHPALGAAPYKLSQKSSTGRTAFSFCMCPGGHVVAATSEAEHVVTNGMSYSDRNSENANAGLLVNVFPEDLDPNDLLSGLKLQDICEHKAFLLGGGYFKAPAQKVGDFLAHRPSHKAGKVIPSYPRGVSWVSLDDCLPSYVCATLRDALPKLDRKLKGFADPDAVLTGVETRSSSPLRITRNEERESCSHLGLWPVGEGAGYAGGIMSAANDGIVTALKIIERHERSQEAR